MHLKDIKNKFPHVPAYQLTYHSKKDFLNQDGIRVVDAHKGLSEIIDYFSLD